MLLDVLRDGSVLPRVSVQQTDSVDDPYIGCLCEPEQLIDVRSPGDFELWTVCCSATNSQITNSDRPEELNEWLVFRTEQVVSLLIRIKV